MYATEMKEDVIIDGATGTRERKIGVNSIDSNDWCKSQNK